MDMAGNTKESILDFIEQILREEILNSSDLQRFQRKPKMGSPEEVRMVLEDWYINMGIETIAGRRFVLSECPFTEEEIAQAEEADEAILCVPKDVTRSQLGKLFRIDSWAVHDRLVTKVTEKEDLWFRTSMNAVPSMLSKTGIEINHQYGSSPYIQFSLERYFVFVGWYRYIYGKNPDQEYWIWLPHGRYDRSGMLMAGFDRHQSFNAHGWMPQFSASFLGARYGTTAKNQIKYG